MILAKVSINSFSVFVVFSCFDDRQKTLEKALGIANERLKTIEKGCKPPEIAETFKSYFF